MNEITHYVAIKFTSIGKGYYFGTDLADLVPGDKVVAESIRGLQVGDVVSTPTPISEYKSSLELKPIIRKATDDDLLLRDENAKRAKESMRIAMEEINKLGLEMRPIDCEYALDGSKITIAYIADDRVDFRDLLKVLAYRFHCRIELRQVGTRDKARMVGGIGICGLPLCCKSFLTNMETISINKAKNQMLTLNIPKLSGHCGKLICCLQYEDDAYTEMKKDFPRIGDIYAADGVNFKVVGLNLLSRVVKLEGDGDVRFVELKDMKDYKRLEK